MKFSLLSLVAACPIFALGIAAQTNRQTTVRVEGRIIDIIADETDPDSLFYILDSAKGRVVVTTRAKDTRNEESESLIGATMSLVGHCVQPDLCRQGGTDPVIQADTHSITFVTNTAPTHLDASPLFKSPTSEVLGNRQRIRGKVIASWPRDNVLIRTQSGTLVRASIPYGGSPRDRNADLPHVGDSVEVIGIPESGLLQNCLTRCKWHPCAAESDDGAPAAERITPQRLLFDDMGRYRVDVRYHGRRVIISGIFTELSSISEFHRQFIINCDKRINIPIYLSKKMDLSLRPGSKVDIEGVCVIDTETWSPHGSIPRIRELLISVSDPSHVRVVQGPPWWTTGRLLSTIGGLLLAILGTVFWNLSLRRILRRKSKALENEFAARLESDLKTRERTRLAVELHDSISQNLSGLAMEIGSAIRLAPTGIDSMLPHLNIASRTLQSCRDDLRDCLWDLRSNALEEQDMNDAIHTTLRPYITAATTLRVRFNVPRKVFSDNLAHTLLRIIRELVSNAIRHGGASEIQIAGTIDGRKLLFSVRDNGCGFDPAGCPGVEQGHFGLQGIRERIQRFDGEMKIETNRSAGSKISITMNISFPQEEDRMEP